MSVKSFDEMLKGFMSSLNLPERSIMTEWERLAGKEMAEHVRVMDLAGGVLRTEADHPGWIQIGNMRKQELLEKIKQEFPEEKIVKIVFSLKKEKLCDS